MHLNAAQLSLEAPLHRAQLRVDPLSRVAALTLPQDALALLPFHASQLELDALDADTARLREVPYAPSFVLSLPSTVDTRLRNVRDAAFLPGLSSPTLAVLCAPAADACAVLIFGLGLGRRAYPVLAAHEGLPVDAEVLVPCPAHVGGALVLGPSGLVHLGASARRVALAEKVDLAGARAAFVGSTTALIVDRDGTSRVLTLAMDGPALGALTLGPPVAQTPSPTLVRAVGKSQALLGSITGDSVLINVDQVEAEDAVETATETVPPPQEQPKDGMELDEDAGRRSRIRPGRY
jgi:cleavage and polyadenylation specificity factor subunit 1